MNAIVQKITLSSSRDIPFNKLMLSQSNVRRVKSGISVEELAESIARRGLIQSLHVRPVLDETGTETGMFEVPAGGRRFRALECLVKQKRLAKTAPVPCIVSEPSDEVLIDEVSLAENIERAPLHPLDQFRAFQAMREKGMTEEAIAAAFFVDVKVVKQRLRLASVSPVLLDIYAEDGMTLEQLMAFTVSDHHDRQVQVWDALKNGWQKDPWHIRRLLTETTVIASDKRARFVGAEAYEAAGGTVLRDLFEQDNGGWFQDVPLLEQMATEKLKQEAEAIAAEGWKWVEIGISLPYGITHGLREVQGTPLDLTTDEEALITALEDEYARIEAEYEGADELPDAVDARMGEIEAALATFEARPMQYDPADIAIGGVFVSIDAMGRLLIERGYVRPQDEPQAQPDDDSDYAPYDTENGAGAHEARQHTVISLGGQPLQAEDEEDDGLLKPLPERLVIELTAHRTLALRDAVAHHPHVAMTALLHKLVSDTFQHRPTSGCLEATVRCVHFPVQSEDLKESPSAQSITGRHEQWGQHLPADDDALWDWLNDLDDRNRMVLLAHCVSYGVNALYEKPNPYGAGPSEHGLRVRMAHAHRLTQATGMNMVERGWRPTVSNYLGRVTKAHILEAVREGAGERAAQLIEHLKKGDMAREAERLLADTGWLPEPLRISDEAQSEGNVDALPAFLTEDSDEDTEDEEATQTAVE